MEKESVAYGRLFARIAEVYLSTLSRKVEPFGLDRYFTALLYIVKYSGTITQKQLGKLLKKDKVSVLRSVNHLCDLGLVIKKQNENDKREHFLAASVKAVKLAPIILQSIEETNAIFFNNFQQNELTNFKSGLAKLMETADKMPSPDFIIRAEKKKNLVFENE